MSDLPEPTPANTLDPVSNRLIAGLVVVCCGAPLVLAAWLKPATQGIGTHTQLGLPPCGFKMATGYPCATCGCTTAFAHATNGSLLQSFLTQPFGAVLAVSLAMLTLIAGWAAVTGMPLAPVTRFLGTRRVVLSGVGLLLAAWAYKAALTGLTG